MSATFTQNGFFFFGPKGQTHSDLSFWKGQLRKLATGMVERWWKVEVNKPFGNTRRIHLTMQNLLYIYMAA